MIKEMILIPNKSVHDTLIGLGFVWMGGMGSQSPDYERYFYKDMVVYHYFNEFKLRIFHPIPEMLNRLYEVGLKERTND